MKSKPPSNRWLYSITDQIANGIVDAFILMVMYGNTFIIYCIIFIIPAKEQ